MNRHAIIFLSALLCMILAVAIFLIKESSFAEKTHHDGQNNFQQVVHGIGLGATAKPTWCYINFDPRIDPRCPCIEWPIPGGYCYCPDHTGTVSYMEGNREMGVAIEIINK